MLSLYFQIKHIVTPKRITWIIICIFIASVSTTIPIFVVNNLEIKFSSTRNKTIFGIVYHKDRGTVEMYCLAINNFIPFVSFFIIVICSITLAIQLHKKNKWRKSTIATTQADVVSGRNQRVAKMVLIISTLFIICFVPTTAIMLAVAFQPSIHLSGKYVLFALMLGEISYTMESINSSLNTIIYYHMSSKYRDTFNRLFNLEKGSATIITTDM